MDGKEYSVSEAVQLTGVPSHVLRYWEEELQIEIQRSSQGHRIYSEKNVEMFRRVKDLKEKGIQLKAIRLLLDELSSEEAVRSKDEGLAEKIREIESRAEQIRMEPEQMEQANAEQTHMEQIHMEQAHMEQTYMEQAHMEEIRMERAHMEQGQMEQPGMEPGPEAVTDGERPVAEPAEQYEIIVDEKKENLRQFEAILKRLIQEVMEEQNEKLERALTGIIREEIGDLYLQYFSEGVREAAAASSDKGTLIGRLRKLLNRYRTGGK